MNTVPYIKHAGFDLITIAALFFLGCAGATSSHNTIESAAFREVLQMKDITIIDLRTPEETANGMIKGCTELDFRDASFSEKLKALPRDKPYAIYCQGGGRSGKALNQMKELGFSEVYDLAGGYSGWLKAQDQ